MLKTYLYIPEHLNVKISQTAKSLHKSKAEVIRKAIEKGISAVIDEENTSAHALLSISEIGKKHKVKGPKDTSQNMDEYLWVHDKKA